MRIMVMVMFWWLCTPFSALAEEWVEAGWQQISVKHYNKALSIWQQGVNQLDDKRLLASIGVYAHFPYALEQLKQVGPAFGAFIVRHSQHHRMLYFVLSSRQVSTDRSTRKTLLADLKQAAGISGMLIAAEAGTLKIQPAPVVYFSQNTVKPVHPTHKKAKVITAKPENSFSIDRFEISGNSLVSTDIILMGLRDFYGAGKTRSDLTSIKDQVVEIYRMSEIYNVRVATPQLIDGDTVQLSIEEKN